MCSDLCPAGFFCFKKGLNNKLPLKSSCRTQQNSLQTIIYAQQCADTITHSDFCSDYVLLQDLAARHSFDLVVHNKKI